MNFSQGSDGQDKIQPCRSAENEAYECSDNVISVRERQLIFENSIYKVYSDHVEDRNGHEVKNYLSIELKIMSGSAITGVSVLPIDNTKIGLIRVFRHPLGKWSWEAVKGHVEEREEISVSAIRELEEEMGFKISKEDLLELGTVSPEAGMIKARIKLFAAIVEAKEKRDTNSELGHNQVIFFTWNQIESLIFQGEVEDATTLCILLQYKNYLLHATNTV